MPEYAPGFDGANKDVLPKNTTSLTNRAVTNALVGTATGAAAGVSTVVNRARIQHTIDKNEARRIIESESLINRNSTAADVTALKTKFTKKRPAFVMPRDLSGNGGPAFTRT